MMPITIKIMISMLYSPLAEKLAEKVIGCSERVKKAKKDNEAMHS
jgi:hypothetical protein